LVGFSESKLAAWLQVIVSRRREEAGLYHEIAGHLPLEGAHRLLDVGTGTGLQLNVIHQLAPDIELYGLDLSGPAIRKAEKALAGLGADLRVGSIADTSFESDFFDIVTCNASLSYWEDPVDCLNEVHRILKPGGEALFFEPHQDIDLKAALAQIRMNMADKGPLRSWGAVQLNRYGLKKNNRLGMKLYSISDLKALVRASLFGEDHTLTSIALLEVPVFIKIRLWKPASAG
jgi:SAM-dependent methyltransferase